MRMHTQVSAHDKITREAIELLNTPALQPIYLELKQNEQAIVDGAYHEDCVDPDLNSLVRQNGSFSDLCENYEVDVEARFLRHFFRPTDELGYKEFGVQYSNSRDWGFNASNNTYSWVRNKSHYSNNQLWNAYFGLGHSVHLVQDASIPEHTHLEFHGNVSAGGVSLTNDETLEYYIGDTVSRTGNYPAGPCHPRPMCPTIRPTPNISKTRQLLPITPTGPQAICPSAPMVDLVPRTITATSITSGRPATC